MLTVPQAQCQGPFHRVLSTEWGAFQNACWVNKMACSASMSSTYDAYLLLHFCKFLGSRATSCTLRCFLHSNIYTLTRVAECGGRPTVLHARRVERCWSLSSYHQPCPVINRNRVLLSFQSYTFMNRVGNGPERLFRLNTWS